MPISKKVSQADLLRRVSHSLIQALKEGKINNQMQLNELKSKACKSFGLKKAPSNIDLALHASQSERKLLKQFLTIKPRRTISGVTPLAIMTKPFACPHGKCSYCPGGLNSAFGNVPQSYTGNEPASLRAQRNHYDGFLQSINRLEQYYAMNKVLDKIELIIMGGTFPFLPVSYQDSFVTDAFKALNVFGSTFVQPKDGFKKFKTFFEFPGEYNSSGRAQNVQKKLLKLKDSRPQKDSREKELELEQLKNEKAKIRCVALCVETRPDYCQPVHIDQMLKLGTTRVEIGLQSLQNEVLKKINRGHSVDEGTQAIQFAKDSFLKVGVHMMLGLPGSSPKTDLNNLKELFSNPAYKPDALKIYPCLVMPGTKLFDDWKKGKYTPLQVNDVIESIAEMKRFVPRYCRIMRIQRDIPSTVIEAGPIQTNLRQQLQIYLDRHSIHCQCIRCREAQDKEIDLDSIKLTTDFFEASQGEEAFISLNDSKNDWLVGFCRLRKPFEPFRKEITSNSAGIRELHVYSPSIELGKSNPISLQHQGFGKQLMAEAERITSEDWDAKKLLVISGIGVKEYYKKLNFKKDGVYLSKKLD